MSFNNCHQIPFWLQFLIFNSKALTCYLSMEFFFFVKNISCYFLSLFHYIYNHPGFHTYVAISKQIKVGTVNVPYSHPAYILALLFLILYTTIDSDVGWTRTVVVRIQTVCARISSSSLVSARMFSAMAPLVTEAHSGDSLPWKKHSLVC